MKKLAILIIAIFFAITAYSIPPKDYTLILTECKDYSEVNAARDFILKQGGTVAIIGSKNVMLGWIDPSISSQLIGQYGIKAIHYRPIDLSTLTTSDRQTIQTVAFFNSKTSTPLKSQVIEEKDRAEMKINYNDIVPRSTPSEKDYLKNLEKKNLDILDLKSKNQLLRFNADGSLLSGNSDVMVGTVAVAIFYVESNGTVDPDLYTWSSADEDVMYKNTMEGLNWWSNMATKYGKNVTFNLIPHYHTENVCQQSYEPILHSSSDGELWRGEIISNLGFQTGNSNSRINAYNTWLRSSFKTDWAYSIFFTYNPAPAPGSYKNGYGAFGGSAWIESLFTWNGDYRIIAHETGHVFGAVDEYSIPGYGGCYMGDENSKSGFPNGNCEEANVNSVDCLMKRNSECLCAFTPGHIGWITEVNQYVVETNIPGLMISVNGRQSVSPQEFPWGKGRKVEISVVSTQTIDGIKYEFLSWNDGGSQSHTITVNDTTKRYIANFSRAGEASQDWKIYQESNGLPMLRTNVVTRDKQGNIWVGTDGGGLSWFDGQNWKTYNTANSGIPSNSITSVVFDAKENMWIGSKTNGIAKFDGANWILFNSSNSELPNNFVQSIAIDLLGNKWIGTKNELVKFDGANWTVYNSSNSGLPDNFVTFITIDGSGNKWIGTMSNGLVKFDDTNWKVYNSSNSGLLNDGVRSMSIDDSGNKWIGTFGGGLYKFDGINWLIYNTSNVTFSRWVVWSITIDNLGNKWIGTGGGGLAKFDGINWSIYNTLNSGLPNNNVNSIIIDSLGNKWIATDDGVVKFDDTNWQVVKCSNFGLPSNTVAAIAIDSSRNKWIGTAKGLTRFDGTNWKVFPFFDNINYISSIKIDSSGNKWLGSWGNGLTKFDGTTWTVFNSSNSDLPDNMVMSIAIDLLGNKWIGTQNGLVKFDGTNWTVFNSSNSYKPINDVRSIATDSLGNIWIGTNGGGIAEFNGTNWTIYNSSIRLT